MAINNVDISVKTIGELRTVHVSELKDGAQAWVIEVEDFFVLVKACGLADDGVNVITPIAGSPRAGNATACWVRYGSDGASEIFCKQQDWFIDPANGNDTNDGKTASTALKTHEELRRRIDGCVIDQPTVVHLLNDFDATNPVRVDFTLGDNALLTYVGEKPTTILYTSLSGFTAVVPTDPPNNIQQLVSDSNLSDDWGALNLLNRCESEPAFLQFRRIRITGGPNIGAISYPVRDINPGTKTARTSEFKVPRASLPGPNSNPTIIPLAGDPFVVETNLALITSLVIDINGSSKIPTVNTNSKVLFYNLSLVSTAEVPEATVQYFAPIGMQQNFGGNTPPIEFSACYVIANTVAGTLVNFDTCSVAAITAPTDSGQLQITTCFVCGQIPSAQFCRVGDRTLFELGGTISVAGICVIDEGGVGIFNAAGVSAVVILPGGVLRIGPEAPLYGSGSDIGVFVSANSAITWQTLKPTITGFIELVVGGFPNTTTWAAFGDNFTNLANLATASKG